MRYRAFIGTPQQDVVFDEADEFDWLFGFGANDFLASTSKGGQSNYFFGGKGADTLVGMGDNQDVLFGQQSFDLIVDIKGGDNVLVGNQGSDTLGIPNTAILFVIQGDDAEQLFFENNPGDNKLFGGQGEDALFGNEGHDMLFGEEGPDRLNAGGGEDYLFGGKGKDMIYTGRGDDLIFAGKGNDTIIFGAEELIEAFESGIDLNNNTFLNFLVITSDVIDSGHDTVSGGKGRDVYFLEEDGTGEATVLDFMSGKDKFNVVSLNINEANFSDLVLQRFDENNHLMVSISQENFSNETHQYEFKLIGVNEVLTTNDFILGAVAS